MRIIAGEQRGMRLEVPAGLAVRPTSDRLRGAVFSSLGSRVVSARVLDACAGSGAIGIEALSRGASFAVFCEPERDAWRALEANLLRTRLAERARVMRCRWQVALGGLRDEAFSLVYFDPPYREFADFAVFLPSLEGLLLPGGRVVVEHPTGAPITAPAEYRILRTLRAGAGSATILESSIRGPGGGKIGGLVEDVE